MVVSRISQLRIVNQPFPQYPKDRMDREATISANRTEYGEGYDSLHWVAEKQARAAAERRDSLLGAARDRITLIAKGTKPLSGALSPGCSACAAGSWSCLFITGICNCRCFYCPTRQDKTGEDGPDQPTTNTVTFPRPDEYVEYIERMGFKGVSISGGEPLLTFDRTLRFATAVKKRFGGSVHLWLYTNGTLADADKLFSLRDAGLDEIRFDIGATDYRLDKVLSAVGIIPRVTVEIPAVPEELGRMKLVMARLREGGVDHLNLHQLRLTPHNYEHLAGRGYTFLHGEKVTVLESELTALELLVHSLDVGMPVNYCSFVYKHRYQRAAARRRSAALVVREMESLTESGYLRSLTLKGAPEKITAATDALRNAGVDQTAWAVRSAGREVLLGPEGLEALPLNGCRLQVSYAAARIVPALSYHHPFTEMVLASGRSLYVERARCGAPLELAGESAERFRRFVSGSARSAAGADGRPDILPFEEIEAGLQEYF
jgi:uncharacterized protein